MQRLVRLGVLVGAAAWVLAACSGGGGGGDGAALAGSDATGPSPGTVLGGGQGTGTGSNGGGGGLLGGGATDGNADATGGTDVAGPGTGDSGGATAGQPGFCEPGTLDCVGPSTVGLCNQAGTEFIETDCPEGQGCFKGNCVPQICQPGQPKGECYADASNEYLACNAAGTDWEPVPCPNGETCYQGQCSNLLCPPNKSVCAGTSAFKVCLPDGSGYGDPQICPKGQLCDPNVGECVDACQANAKANIYLGCEYLAVDLDNVEGGEAQPVGVVVSAPADNQSAAELTFTDLRNGQKLSAADLGVASLQVQPGELVVFTLPVNGSQGSNPLDGSIVTKAGYAIRSTAPVTVHQFNPLNGDNVFTNDASLLLPTNLAGREYFAMSWPHNVVPQPEGDAIFHGFISVLAVEDGETNVEVIPRASVASGVSVPPISPMQSRTFTLTRGDVLNLETSDVGDDLTGTWIHATKKIVVFSGHECANIPKEIGFCDHVEQQLFPVSTWGKEYVADAFYPRNDAQFDVWRIVGGADGVHVTTDPPVHGFESFTVNKGTWVEMQVQGSFRISGDGPFAVAHYLTGSNYPGFDKVCEGAIPSGIGDPALTLAVPVGQFLNHYVVLTPPGYQENYLNIVALSDAAKVEVDGAPVAMSPESVGASGYVVYQVPVSEGVHTIDADGPIGVTAYGYDCDVSYAYPGGLRLKKIN